ncbi:hypothetical protein TcWFU_006132 [Taenia crassiceps]|uniref:Uncharacterized protein n=1 Tax=Taenia crassiceps TaxID=6207 RepID=A0ABR4Q809_9CEST
MKPSSGRRMGEKQQQQQQQQQHQQQQAVEHASTGLTCPPLDPTLAPSLGPFRLSTHPSVHLVGFTA